MIESFVSALVDAAMKAGANRDALETSIRAIVTTNIDTLKRETSSALTLQGWTPPQRISADEVAKALPKGLAINPQPQPGELRSLGDGAIGLTGFDVMQLPKDKREALDRIMYKFSAPEDQDAIILKPQYRAQYENGTLFEI